MATDLLQYIPSFSSANFWLSKKGAIGAAALGLVVAGFLRILGCLSSVPLWNIIAIASLLALSVLTWFVIIQIYLHTGQATKIGLAYDGYKVEPREWARIRNMLRDLLKNGKITNQVSLRFVPVRTTKIDRYAKKYMKRYGFTILVAIQQSPHIKEDNHKHDQHPFFPEVSIRLTKVVEKQFVETTLKRTVQIVAQRTKTINTLSQVVEARVRNLHDMMLLLIATLYYREHKYEDCAAISQHLDQSLSLIMGPSQEPRIQVRSLDMSSRLRPSVVSVRDLPAPDKLKDIRDFAETALRYFDEFPAAGIDISRIRFLTGDDQGAIRLTERFGAKIEEVKKAGRQPTGKVLVVYLLNSGFLSFIQGHWFNAYDFYAKMLSVPEYHNEDWDNLIEFIDYVETLERYDGICCLQMFYRLIANKPVPPELRKASQEWLNQDDSRKELRTLLSRSYPQLVKTPQKLIASSEKDDKKVKQRSKRKEKPRKKKRKRR